MRTGRPKPPIVLSPEDRTQLESFVSSRSLPAGLVSRGRIVLMAAEGLTNRRIAVGVGLTEQTVGKWRQRFLKQGAPGAVR